MTVMERILFARHSRALHGVARTRAIEASAMASMPAHALMRRAGLAVSRLALAVAPHARHIWIAAGPGNNGGDGLDAAIHLRATGKQVHVSWLGDPARVPADAADALVRAQADGVVIESGLSGANQVVDLAIDALLGIGATRAPAGDIAQAIAMLNDAACRVLAVDVPSGLDAEHGRVLGLQAVRATHTLSLLTLKPGLFTAHGRDHAGDIWLDDLDVPEQTQFADAWLLGSETGSMPPRPHSAHKGSFGDVAVVGGAPGMLGAVVLAARAAHASGAGRVYVAPLDDEAAMLDAVRPELMFRRHWWQADDAILQASTVVCGCGGGDAVRAALPRLLGAAGRLVVDADALNCLATDSMLQSLLHMRAGRGRFTVLTPHPLEAARLLGWKTTRIQDDRLAAARELADRFACVVVLKGSGSIIAAPDTVPCINPTGNARLATAGTGDVLAGWLGGVWAQQADQPDTQQAMRVACAAVHRHGAAADRASAVVLRAGDLIEAMATGA